MSDSVWLTTVSHVIARVWSSAITPTPTPGRPVLLVCAGTALAIVLVTPIWRPARNAISLAHEGSHGLAALVTGRQLRGIQLHSDTSGVTLSRGRPTGFGMWLTAVAGYIGPSLIGLCAAGLLGRGYAMAVLWLLVVLLALLLLQIRNWYGLFLVLFSAAALVALAWFGAPDLRSAAAYVVTWFLLAGAVRPIVELQIRRARGETSQSDVDQLAQLTGVPGLVWVGMLLAATVGGLFLGTTWMLGAN